MNGDDDHDRILKLEEKMGEVREAIADMRGSNKAWTIVLATIISVAFGIAQSWFTKPTTNDEVISAVKDLQHTLELINQKYGDRR